MAFTTLSTTSISSYSAPSNSTITMMIPMEKRCFAKKAKKVRNRPNTDVIDASSLNSLCVKRETLYGPIDSALIRAIIDYDGPRVIITSAHRAWSKRSKHYCGKALDLDLTPEVAEYLVSPSGEAFLQRHGLEFFIEDKPGSKELRSYSVQARYAPFIFKNPFATGSHIHLQLK